MIHITNGLKSVGIDIKRKVFKEIHDNLGGNIRIIVSAAAPIDKKGWKLVRRYRNIVPSRIWSYRNSTNFCLNP